VPMDGEVRVFRALANATRCFLLRVAAQEPRSIRCALALRFSARQYDSVRQRLAHREESDAG
jgi:hypothetical protein